MIAPLDLTFEVTANADAELTCFACRLSRCELAMRAPGNGNVSWYGLHNRCYPIVKARTPDLGQKLSDARAALRKIADGNPAPVGKWLSDVEMADIARRALAGTTAPVAVPVPEHYCLACGGLICERLPASDYNVDVCWECADEYKKACDGDAPNPVQAAYAECAEVAFDAMENYCTCSRPETKCRTCLALVEVKLEIESAAARARGGK